MAENDKPPEEALDRLAEDEKFCVKYNVIKNKKISLKADKKELSQ